MSLTSAPITQVVFRRWRDTKDIFALFPESPSDYEGYYCDSYQTIGGHGGADYSRCIHATDPVTVVEAADLIRELERIGYRLKPIKRASWRIHEARRNTAKSLK